MQSVLRAARGAEAAAAPLHGSAAHDPCTAALAEQAHADANVAALRHCGMTLLHGPVRQLCSAWYASLNPNN